MSLNSAPRLLLVGPTAVGKTAVAVELARRWDGEVVSLDSMQVYRGVPILTGAAREDERRGVPHHMLEEVDPWVRLDAQQYRERVIDRLQEVSRRGRPSLLVGGSGLHLTALRQGLSPLPPADADLRKRLEQRERDEGPGTLHRELRQLDPSSAASIHPADLVRTVRALEIQLSAGRRASDLRGAPEPGPAAGSPLVCLTCDRDELNRRIEARVDEMWSRGVLDEVGAVLRRLRSRGLVDEEIRRLTVAQAIGFRVLWSHLDGELTEEEAQLRHIRDTRRYAKRQRTWYRKVEGLRCIPAGGGRTVAEVADMVAVHARR